MGIFSRRKQDMSSAERRRFPRRLSDGVRVYLHARGRRTCQCKVRDISRSGIFIETDDILPLAFSVELAFTCLHTRNIVKIYRRSAYIARASEDGLVAVFFDRGYP